MKEKIACGAQLLKEGKLKEARNLFWEIQESTNDETTKRIINNRLKEVEEKIRQCNHILEVNSNFFNESLSCILKITTPYKHVNSLIQRIYNDIHRKDYAPESSLEISCAGNGIKITISSKNIDPKCCQLCKNFRQKVIDNIGLDDLLIEGKCCLEN